VRNTSSQNPSQIRTWNLGILIAARFSTGLRSSTDTQPIRATDPEPGSKECRSGSTKLKKDKKRARNFVSGAFLLCAASHLNRVDRQRRTSEQNGVATAATRLPQKAV
jgi:hypothetical protein